MKRRALALLLALPLLAACSAPETVYNWSERDRLSDAADAYLDCQWEKLQEMEGGETMSLADLRDKCGFDLIPEPVQLEVEQYEDDFHAN